MLLLYHIQKQAKIKVMHSVLVNIANKSLQKLAGADLVPFLYTFFTLFTRKFIPIFTQILRIFLIYFFNRWKNLFLYSKKAFCYNGNQSSNILKFFFHTLYRNYRQEDSIWIFYIFPPSQNPQDGYYESACRSSFFLPLHFCSLILRHEQPLPCSRISTIRQCLNTSSLP